MSPILRNLSLFALFTFCFGWMTACSPIKPAIDDLQISAAPGSLMIARAVPNPKLLGPLTLIGLVPQRAGKWLSVDRNSQRIDLMDGSVTLLSVEAQGLANLNPGHFQLLHKQRNALWYASDEYYAARESTPPDEGDRSRYLRGAFGDFVLFLDKNTPIHSSPIWSEEVGGVRIAETEMTKIYYSLALGAPIEVR